MAGTSPAIRDRNEPLSLQRIASVLQDRQARVTGRQVSFRCLASGHEDRRPSCVAWVSERGGLRVWCYRCGSPDELWRAVADRLGMNTRWYRPPPAVSVVPVSRAPEQDRSDVARRIWFQSLAISNNIDHPARHWFAARNLWRVNIPAPPALRWLPAGPAHLGAGSIVALLAAPEAWDLAWPAVPAPAAVQLIAVDGSGHPTLDRRDVDGGLNKRTVGEARGAVLVIGNPSPGRDFRVVEGVADGLAIASRYDASVVVMAGTSGMRNQAVADWLAKRSGRVTIHADADEVRQGRSPAGTSAAGRLRRAIRAAGANCVAVYPPAGFKDAAEAAAAFGFVEPDDSWVDYARTLAETTDWPCWEIARIAQIVAMERCVC